jgi:hypothetical protein
VKLRPFDRQNHKGFVYGGTSDIFEDNLKPGAINNEIAGIEITCNKKSLIIPQEKIIDYCDVGYLMLIRHPLRFWRINVPVMTANYTCILEEGEILDATGYGCLLLAVKYYTNILTVVAGKFIHQTNCRITPSL